MKKTSTGGEGKTLRSTEVEKGYGCTRVWMMLKTDGIDIKRSAVRNYCYKRNYYYMRYEKKRDVCYLYVTADSLLKFYRLVGLTIECKRRRLEDYLMKRGLLETPTQQPSPFSFSRLLPTYYQNAGGGI